MFADAFEHTSSNGKGERMPKWRTMLTAAPIAVVVLLGLAAPAQAADPDGDVKPLACVEEHSYASISNKGQTHFRLGPGYQNYNGTSSTATVTLTATVGGTVSWSASTSLAVKGSVLVVEAEGTLGLNLSTSLTASVTNSIRVTARAKTTVYGDYGVWRQKVYGNYGILYPSCNSQSAWVTSYLPARVGWNVWGG